VRSVKIGISAYQAILAATARPTGARSIASRIQASAFQQGRGRYSPPSAKAGGQHRSAPDAQLSGDSAPPPGFEREIPKYRATRDIQPAPKARFRFEPPFTTLWDVDVWQYGERPIQSGEIIETREWPHPSFRPLNYSARKVLDFFNSRMKSRLPRSPWQGNQIMLDDGITGPAQPNISIKSGVTGATAA
jgi:hypothetical protein